MSGARAAEALTTGDTARWWLAAACGPGAEMVPDADDAGEGVQLAKKVCGTCPDWVRAACLYAAAAVEGGEPHGVWGGLTRDERILRHGLLAAGGPDPAGVCARCALPCVPPQPRVPVLCAGCGGDPDRVAGDVEAHRPLIAASLRAGQSYRQIGDALGVPARTVRAACRRWSLRSNWSARRPDRQVEPCGTPAARRRHQRRGEPVCEACREANRRATAQYRCRATGARPGPRDIHSGTGTT